jgi:hypothetical protein
MDWKASIHCKIDNAELDIQSIRPTQIAYSTSSGLNRYRYR